MPDNIKYTARIPIVPDSLANQLEHKDREIVFDFDEDDIYIKRGDKYVNITGQIRETVDTIKDGSCVIHIVTEETLPAIKDREKNHWYYVVTEASDYYSDESTIINSYIYYGVINTDYYSDRSYLLIAQNMLTDPDVVKITAPEGYKIAFYVPSTYDARFFNDETDEELSFSIQDRLYTMSGTTNISIAYDVYISSLANLGTVYVRVDFTGTDWYVITLKASNEDIEGITLPTTSIKVADGNVIGTIKDPTWTNPRYVFSGWSTKKNIYEAINTTTYVPTDNMVIYAYFEYDNDDSKYTYKCIYTSSTGTNIGTFYSVALPNTMIAAKDFDGYTTPTTKVQLVRDEQLITFTYEPITYPITYDLDGGEFPSGSNEWSSYNVENEYTPPTPAKDEFSFERWSPRKIDSGTIGPVSFKAYWVENGIIDGTSLRTTILGLYANIATIVTKIVRSTTEPTSSDNAINISKNSTDVLIWYNSINTTIYYYTANEISCTTNMSGVFKDFTKLRDIASLGDWVLEPTTNIEEMFYGCTALSDVSSLVSWKLTGKAFSDAFTGTAAYASGRLPSWYVWTIIVRYISSVSDNLLRSDTLEEIPNSTYVPGATIQYYTVPTTGLIISQNNKIFEVKCVPTSWTITYALDGGEFASDAGQKTSYTIEDSSVAAYTPPTPTKSGATFDKWTPTSIPINNTGNVAFTASWK